MIRQEVIDAYVALLEEQLSRAERIAQENALIDYNALSPLIIGICAGDGIGPSITRAARDVVAFLLADRIQNGSVILKDIPGMTLERRIEEGAAIPADVLRELKTCHVILKGPTTTPRAGDGMPNVESANVAMRRELDLFANVRPVRIPEKGIDWIFFRENTEGSYTLGSRGMKVSDDLAIDFTIATTEGCRRICALAFDFAAKNHKTRVSAVTKANIIKTTDGKFLEICRSIAANYPDITFDDWYVDIMSANLVDEKRQRDFQVIVLPNLYGDILTDEAAQIQGGVGTAGSANIGSRYAMFEAIHGSAPRMVTEGRDCYANPCSMLRAAALMLAHIGEGEKSALLDRALDLVSAPESGLKITGRADGATTEQFARRVMEVVTAFSTGQAV